MSVICSEEVSLIEIDEALSFASASLKTDHYGNRMDWRKKEILLSSIDDLLDERLSRVKQSQVQGGSEL